ncbi:hypothetical protein M501DRAFT_943025 [Patellaria atrata CBS 101060]|uniref:Uncharacterized protein n=1 Tax=Patellaria atrata CBS 101060 TaxID=1346257 RepID=A0A9P4VMR2_9PEZI|nr:hypothetical protein M501DRAFT_943025 [Patellaria atrata CBS 101060]
MSFAPYQDTTPETVRALSPPPTSPHLSPSPRASLNATRNIGTAAVTSPRNEHAPRSTYFDNPDVERGQSGLPAPSGFGSGREDIDMFETRLGIRMDYEACLAYLLLPPAGAVLLLVLEHRSDYVRFHAWQSSLLFTFMFIVHIIFSWTSFISYLLLICDLGLIGYLTFKAYQDAAILDRCELPFFGPLASSILDGE